MHFSLKVLVSSVKNVNLLHWVYIYFFFFSITIYPTERKPLKNGRSQFLCMIECKLNSVYPPVLLFCFLFQLSEIGLNSLRLRV